VHLPHTVQRHQRPLTQSLLETGLELQLLVPLLAETLKQLLPTLLEQQELERQHLPQRLPQVVLLELEHHPLLLRALPTELPIHSLSEHPTHTVPKLLGLQTP
jgi:hypothetical protein